MKWIVRMLAGMRKPRCTRCGERGHERCSGWLKATPPRSAIRSATTPKTDTKETPNA